MGGQPQSAQQTKEPSETILAFDRGLDRSSPRTALKKGGYDGATNILLMGDQSSKHPTSMALDAVLDSLVTWPPGNPQWTAPFSYTTYTAATQLLVFNTHLVVARAGGQYHRYDAGAPGTVTNVRRMSNVAGVADHIWQINSFVYDKWLCTVDGRNPPMKYGQHWIGLTTEPTPYMFPIGSYPITPGGPQTLGETWTFTGAAGFITDAALITAGALGARVGDSSVKLPTVTSSTLVWTTTQNFSGGPSPYGGRAFTNADSFAFQTFKAASGATPTLTFTFWAPDVANTWTYTTPTLSAGSTVWDQNTALRSAFTAGAGAPNWATVNRLIVTNNDNGNTVYLDDLYFLYSDAPPPAQVGTSHKDRIVLGGAPLIGITPALGTIAYSNAQNPDNFANGGVNNTQSISGGFESLAKVNQITALREYQDSVIVGTPSAIFAWTVGAVGTPAKSTISTEHGIDSQRGVIETPNGSLIFPWQRGFYILRATGRQFVGAKIQPFIVNMATDDPSWTMTVLDEATKTIRIWYREGLLATAVSSGLVFDYVQAQEMAEAVWPSQMTQMADWAVPVYISGARKIIQIKANDPQLYVMGGSTTGTLTSELILPWMGGGDDTKATKWMGVDLAYASKVPLEVYVRYATNPQEFDSASFVLRRTLPANPTITEQARVLFGGTTRWSQVKLRATSLAAGGFELFPPVKLVPYVTARPGG